MSVGNNLRILRERKSLSQKELAELVGVTTGTIAEWESNETELSFADAAKLCEELDVSTDMLLVNIVDQSEQAEPQADDKKAQKETKKKNKLVWIAATAAFLLSVVVVLLFFIGNSNENTEDLPPTTESQEMISFSENAAAIETADASVVKVFCYDVFGEISATGSGFFAFDGQTIITNYHVIKAAYTCKISTNQDVSYEVSKVLCYSEAHDIAILQLKDNTDIAPLTLGDSSAIKKGEAVIAIGSPLGIKNTVSSGIISARITEDSMEILQFTAPISNGSSGGALFDNNGNVIGITYALDVDGQNLNLAIPIELAVELYENIDPCDLTKLYKKNYSYVSYLLPYKNAEVVSIGDLKQNPKKYDDQYIALYAYVSSQGEDMITPDIGMEKWYFSDEKHISYDFEYDNWIAYPSNGTSYRDCAVMGTDPNSTYSKYVDFSIKEGDFIIVLAYFEYFPKGELRDASNPNFGIIEYSTARLNSVVIAPVD